MRFVIHHHIADRAGEHFDLRLENDKGSLSSWAIPKGKLPSRGEKFLAKKVGNHSMEYGKFKGRIPKGEYGAGKVEIYDSGTYEDLGRSGGSIKFRLNGRKNKGAFVLVRTDGDNWLIMPYTKVDEAVDRILDGAEPILAI